MCNNAVVSCDYYKVLVIKLRSVTTEINGMQFNKNNFTGVKEMFCKNCGANVNDGEMFCPACGVKQDVVETPAAPQQPVYNEAPSFQQAPAAPAAKKGFDLNALKELTKHKLFKPVAAAIAVLLVVCIVLVPVLGTVGAAQELDFYLYVKDDTELFIKYSKDKEAKRITDDLVRDDDITYVTDADYLFFYEADKEDVVLKYVDLGAKKLEPVEVDDDVASYKVSKNGKTVFFKDSDGALYVSNLKDKEKIDKNVASYSLNEKGDKCVYSIKDADEKDKNEAYTIKVATKKLGAEPKVIAEEVGPVLDASRDNSIVLYADREKIMSVSNGKTKAKEAYTVENWSSETEVQLFVVSDKEFYVTVGEKNPYLDYVTDSYDAEEDKEADYGEDGYYRNQIRESFEEMTHNNSKLIYVKGGKGKLVAENVTTAYLIHEKGYLYFNASVLSESGKVSIDDLVKAYDDDSEKSIYEIFSEEVFDGEAVSLAIKGKASVISSSEDTSKITRIKIDEKGKNLYYMSDIDEGEGKIYRMKISSSLGKAKEVYSGVNYYLLNDKGEVISLRNFDDGECELFVKNKKVASNVTVDYDMEVSDDGKKELGTVYGLIGGKIAEDGTIFFFTDYKDDKGTLQQLSGKKVTKIASDVSDYETLGKNDIMFIDDEEDLYVYNKKSSKNFASDVEGFVNIDVDIV